MDEEKQLTKNYMNIYIKIRKSASLIIRNKYTIEKCDKK